MDIGCGTGVPTLWIAENYNGVITAIDSDTKTLNWLQEKINKQNLSRRVDTKNKSFFDLESDENQLDIILAEGFLNIAGFQR